MKKRKLSDLQVEYLASVDSTNDYLLRKAAEGCNTPLACFAETQTQGKGRRNGRTWFSPPGSNVYLSLLWHFSKEPQALSALGLAVALCVVQTLEGIGIQKPVGIKWPNDLLSEGKKLGGILIESLPCHQGITRTVMGIGLNVYPFEASEQSINQPWTTVQALSQTLIDRSQLAALLLDTLVETVLNFEAQGFEAFYNLWPRYDLTFNKNLTLTDARGSVQGRGRGIHTDGRLIVENAAGVLEYYASGEVSLRVHEASWHSTPL
ncbi:MAG: biotin--[acetyl-CoA-carboxylase] ligase [Gammaproteobacteria bacterium]|nr:biotin--[acetyl-CoA-carboxylase] ligase [Gammaproteobacteria bacterium]